MSESSDHSENEIDEPVSAEEFSFVKCLKAIVGQLKLGADVTRITLPSVFSTPNSLLEALAEKRLRGMELVRDIPMMNDPIVRMIAVMRWVISVVGDMDEFGKKPLNPILGEICRGTSPVHPECMFIAEQVSHHPPVTAFRVTDEQSGIYYQGALEVTTKFQGNSVSASWVGEGKLHIGPDDVYICNRHYPPLVAKGLIMGGRRMALEGDITITHATTGVVGKLNFQTKDKKVDKKRVYYFTVDGSVLPGAKGKAVATLKGIASEQIKVSFPKGKDVPLPFANGDVILDAKDISPGKPIQYLVPDDPELSARFSTNVWGKTCAALRKCDFEKADEEKKVIEEAERARRQQWEQSGATPPPPTYFRKQESDHTYTMIEQ